MEQISTALASKMSNIEPVSMVSFRTSQGLEGQGTVVRLTPQSITFEVYSPRSVLRLSEVLTNFSIYADTRPIYSARAVVSNVINAGSVTVCEATLPGSLLDLDLFQMDQLSAILPSGFAS